MSPSPGGTIPDLAAQRELLERLMLNADRLGNRIAFSLLSQIDENLLRLQRLLRQKAQLALAEHGRFGAAATATARRLSGRIASL